ncbi:hypothetical protein BGZ96_001488 [Linnemannia gamsii]|uniref:Uncharacterized protein n=1 Tax=Linnemannia gamsii TaxID=64522 RepID=A0ABQ7K9R2_9FUNG|nr:hypothetical protein BGZ96_001488 [Linnemannia gamsii]
MKLPIELGLHGTIAFLSLYAAYSILATIRFQNLHGYTSLTALFLFLVTAASFVMAIGYMILAWWMRTTEGSIRIQSRLLRQRHGRLVFDVEASTTKHTGESTLSRTAELATRAVFRVSVFLVSPLPRLCILLGLVAASFLAAIMQWYKIRNGLNCAAVAPEYQRFCATTKAAVTSTTVATCFWILWLGLWFRQSYSVFREEQKIGVLQQQQKSGSRHSEDILIAMPGEAHGVSRAVAMNQPFKHTRQSNSSNKQMEPQLQHLQNDTSSQQQERPFSLGEAFDAKDSSLGLGIDITTATTINGDNGAGTSSYSGSATTNTGFDSSTPQYLPVRSKFMDVETASIVGKSATSIARESIFEREKPNPGRVRDHAKIFPMTRASISNLQEAAAVGVGGSNRRTPVIFAAGSLAQLYTGGGGGSPLASGANTPVTPRSRAGYMGKETLKALNNLPRSSSMGAIFAAHNNILASGVPFSSAHASPIPNNSHHFSESYNISGTPNSIRSYRSMNAFPQSPAEATFAEHSMDEQLKAIRRRSFASDAMNSPGGSASLLESAQMNSPSLMMAMTPRCGSGGGGSEVGSTLGMSMGSPSSSIFSRGKGKFRSAFSSPSLNTLTGGSGRRRSSLGMTSMINSTIKSPADSGDDSSSSSYHSLAESATTPHSTDYSLRLHRRPSDAETTSSSSDNDGQSSLYSTSRIRQQLAISAQDLLRAEYGDLYPVLLGDSESGLLNDMENMNPESDSIISMGRTRSNSVSSVGTSRSSGSYSYSSSNEQGQGQGRMKQPGPPPSLMNKVRNGAGKYRPNKNYQQKQQQTVRKGGSNGTLANSKSNSRLNSKKFPSQGDLTKYSWDYRKELPID